MYLGGMPLRDVDIQSYRSIVGNNIYGQDLFFGTLEDNLTLGKKVSPKRLLEVLDQVKLSEFYRSLDSGFKTEINPQNQSITKAVRQKIYLARVLVAKPKFIVLDDGLASLSKSDRHFILNQIANGTMPWTLVIISRDTELSQYCDQHYYLNKGVLSLKNATNHA